MYYLKFLEVRYPTCLTDKKKFDQGAVRAAFFPGGYRRKSIWLLFQLLEAVFIPWLMDLSSMPKPEVPVQLFLYGINLTLTLLPPSFTYNIPCDGINPFQIIQNNLPCQNLEFTFI